MRRQEKNRRILGIDPGSIFCGYGIVERSGKNGMRYVISGRIQLNRKNTLHERLRELFNTLVEIIREFRPHDAAVERVFFAKGVKAALNLGHARGVALLAAAMENLGVFEYSALEVKKSVAGYGRADKGQVNSMVSRILNITHSLSEDSADALALALCHIHTIDMTKMTGELKT